MPEDRHRKWLRRTPVAFGTAFLACPLAYAQATQPPPVAAPPVTSAAEAPARLGRFRVGPFYLTPTFHIGTIGVDNNVFYTATERTTDVSASGGPGLDLVLPLGDSGRLFACGTLDYLHFVKTESQRRLRWNASSGFDFKGSRTTFHLEEAYAETFGRPSYEIDERISQSEEATRLDFKRRLFGRIAIRAIGLRARFRTEGDPDYLGNDLSATLSRNEYLARGGVDYAITIKTSFVIEGDQQWDRFPLYPIRDADSNRLWGGFRTDSTALLSGQALVGFRWFRPVATPGYEVRKTIADVNFVWNISPKTHIGFLYGRDLDFSAFQTSGLTSTVFNERLGVRIEKDLVGNLDVMLFGRITSFLTDGEITIDLPDGTTVTAVRDDRAREVGIDLGYHFRPRLRIGVAATYVDRNSNISYFGIDGLLIGATVRFSP